MGQISGMAHRPQVMAEYSSHTSDSSIDFHILPFDKCGRQGCVGSGMQVCLFGQKAFAPLPEIYDILIVLIFCVAAGDKVIIGEFPSKTLVHFYITTVVIVIV